VVDIFWLHSPAPLLMSGRGEQGAAFEVMVASTWPLLRPLRITGGPGTALCGWWPDRGQPAAPSRTRCAKSPASYADADASSGFETTPGGWPCRSGTERTVGVIEGDQQGPRDAFHAVGPAVLMAIAMLVGDAPSRAAYLRRPAER